MGTTRMGGRASRRVVALPLVLGALLGSSVVAAPFAGAVTDVAKTMNVNSSRLKITTTTAGQRIVVTFQGLVSEVVTVSTASGTFGANCNASLTLQDPTAATVAGPACAGVAGSLTSVTLAKHGLYRAVLTPVGSAVGSVSVRIATSGSVRSLTPSGNPPEKVTIPAHGTVTLGFDAASGSWLTALATSGTYTNTCDLSLSFLTPANTDLQGSFCIGSGSQYWEPLPRTSPLATTGIYKAKLTSTAATSGSVLLQNWVFTDTTGPLTLGTSVMPQVTQPGQRVRYTFTGTSGQHITTKLTNASFPPYGHYYVTYYTPSGTVFFQTGEDTSGGPNAFIDPITLDQSGAWQVEIDGYLEETGHVTMLVSSVNDITGTITVGGPTKTVTISKAGQRARYTFTGSNGQNVTATLGTGTFSPNGDYYVNFYAPGGALYSHNLQTNAAGTVGPVALNAAGTWTVEIDPYLQDVGGVTLRLS